MKITLLDQINIPSGDKPSEDCIGFNTERGSFWVIDGATDLYPEQRFFPEESSDAHWYAVKLNTVFGNVAHAKTDDGNLDFLERVIQKMRGKFTKETGVKAQNLSGFRPSQIPSAAAIWMRAEGNQLITVRAADCEAHILTDSGKRFSNADPQGKNGELSRNVDLVSKIKLVNAVRKVDIKFSLGDPTTLDALRIDRDTNAARNLSLFECAAERFDYRAFELPKNTGATIFLASDGFLRLVDVFNTYTHEELIHAAMPGEKGLEVLVAELRALENEAIARGDTRQVKGHDDASALLLQIES